MYIQLNSESVGNFWTCFFNLFCLFRINKLIDLKMGDLLGSRDSWKGVKTYLIRGKKINLEGNLFEEYIYICLNKIRKKLKHHQHHKKPKSNGVNCCFCVFSRLLPFVVLPCSTSAQRISHFVVLSHLESSSMVSSTERVATNRILTTTWCRFFWPTSWVNVTLPKFNMEPHFMKSSKINVPF